MWADRNTDPSVCERLRSRRVAQVLASTVRDYAAQLQEENYHHVRLRAELQQELDKERKQNAILLAEITRLKKNQINNSINN